MTTLLLTSFLGMITYLVYENEHADLVSPPFIVSFMFLLSSLTVLINLREWNVDLSLITVFLIVTSVIFFYIGYRIAIRTVVLKKNKLSNNDATGVLQMNYIRINTLIVACSIFFLCVTAVLYYRERMRLASTLGAGGSLFSVISAARHAEYYTDETMSELVQRLLIISKSISYVLAYAFVNNANIKKPNQKDFLSIIPILVYGAIMLLSGGRMSFIHILSYLIILFAITAYRRNGISAELRAKIMKAILRVVLIFFALFIYMGFNSGKITSSIRDSVSVYVGSSINALDIFMKTDMPDETVFGQETLIPVYSALRSFGIMIPKVETISAREFVSMNGVRTNVYTALRRYVRDYSIPGCFLIMIFLGFLYGKFYRYTLTIKSKDYSRIIYASIFYPLIEMSIEERFFLKVFSLKEIYELIIIFVLYYVLIRPSQRRTMNV